ncbi:MAG: heme exporter protein CcmB [Flavobacteriales bacterium]|nr:heme exporter protein CcmB [Flavobacteriales bacterium]
MLQALLKKELMLELRQKHALAGIVIYILSTVFVCYLSIQVVEQIKVWGALLWITGLFTAFSAMQKTFSNEGKGVHIYLHTLTSPRKIILAKSIYNAALVALLNVFCLLLFVLFLGKGVLDKVSYPQLFLAVILGSAGLGTALSFMAGMAFRTGNNTGLISVIGFPIVIPQLITLVKATSLALGGVSFVENSLQFVILCSLLLASLVLALILFPYLWRD